MDNGKCAIWGTDAKLHRGGDYITYNSPRAGGAYRIWSFWDRQLSEQFNLLTPDEKAKLTSQLISKKISGDELPSFDRGYDLREIVDAKFLSVSARVERFFRFCSSKNIRPGKPIYSYKKSTDGQSNVGLENEEILAWTETPDFREFRFFVQILREAGYLVSFAETLGHSDYDILTAAGFSKLEEYERTNNNSKQAFVAMWFDSSLNDVYANGIEPAIMEAGYEPRIIRNVEHNNKIDDEIIAEIRRSKFVIADFTCGFSEDKQPIARGGVYYEAGFAQGLGLPVIWTCRSDIINHVHFDTRQYNHIVWDTPDDLKSKLLNRIRATIT